MEQQDLAGMNNMDNSVSIVERTGLDVSRFSRVVRCYSVQEVLLEYCLCLLSLAFVALVTFTLQFFSSGFRVWTCSCELLECTDSVLVS